MHKIKKFQYAGKINTSPLQVNMQLNPYTFNTNTSAYFNGNLNFGNSQLFQPKVTNGSPAKQNVPSLQNQLAAQGISSITGWASDQLSDNIFGDSEVGRNVGNIFSQGVSSFGNTLADNVVKGQGLFQGAGINTGSAVAGAAAGMAANYIGKGINSLGGNSKLSRGIGQGVATGLGSIGGLAAQNLVKTGSVGNLFGKTAGSINPVGLGMSVVGSGLQAAFGPSKEYGGKYGGITRGMDTAYDLVQGAVGFVPGWGQVVSGAMALNKGLSNVFGSTDGMTRQDAILGSAFMPAPVKWLNMAGAKTTQNFNDQSWQNTERTNSFMQNGFGDLGDRLTKAREEAGKTYGTFSQGARKRADQNLTFANQAWQKLLDMTDTNELQNIRSQYMSSINNQRYAQMIQGGFSPLSRKEGGQILNNATNHKVGMRLLSGAALIDNKQMILCSAVD